MAGRMPITRSRCSLDVRPAAPAQSTNRRMSMDTHAHASFATPNFASMQTCLHTASNRQPVRMQAVADVQQQEVHKPRVEESNTTPQTSNNLPRVLIAGAGIGGLVLAVALLKRGFQVQIFERDMTAIRGEGKYRGPIQVWLTALRISPLHSSSNPGISLDTGSVCQEAETWQYAFDVADSTSLIETDKLALD